jgi:PDZ domain-containing protein
MNFVLLTPGKPTPLFPQVLSIKGIPTHSVDGQMYLLTVMITNPDTYVQGTAVARCWVDGECVTFPRSVYYQRETDNKSEIAIAKKEMVGSQNFALTAARSLLQKRFPDVDISQLTDSHLAIKLANTGGPSGGFIFALGIVELITPENLLQGRKVAGTGTISATGAVGAIGGVTEKIIGAKKAGASLLFISRENCQDLPPSVEGISVVAIATLDEAITYLDRDLTGAKPLNSAGIHGCASVGA